MFKTHVTRPMDHAIEAQAYLDAHPDETVEGLAKKLQAPACWMRSRLGLLKLSPEDQDRLRRGELSLTDAYLLTGYGK